MLNPCRNRFSASSLRGCRHTLQGRLTSMSPLAPPAALIASGTAKSVVLARYVHCEELAVRLVAILPKLLSAFDEHTEVLADQPPR